MATKDGTPIRPSPKPQSSSNGCKATYKARAWASVAFLVPFSPLRYTRRCRGQRRRAGAGVFGLGSALPC